MPRAWRIVRASQAATAFDGEGAWLYGGRWNSRGIRVVYTSSTLSLAALETLVHLTPPVSFRYVAIPLDFDRGLVENLDRGLLPGDWSEEPPSPATKTIGDQWVRGERSAVLELPSAIIPGEANYLLNPLHPDFRRIALGKPEPFSFDARLR